VEKKIVLASFLAKFETLKVEIDLVVSKPLVAF